MSSDNLKGNHIAVIGENRKMLIFLLMRFQGCQKARALSYKDIKKVI